MSFVCFCKCLPNFCANVLDNPVHSAFCLPCTHVTVPLSEEKEVLSVCFTQTDLLICRPGVRNHNEAMVTSPPIGVLAVLVCEFTSVVLREPTLRSVSLFNLVCQDAGFTAGNAGCIVPCPNPLSFPVICTEPGVFFLLHSSLPPPTLPPSSLSIFWIHVLYLCKTIVSLIRAKFGGKPRRNRPSYQLCEIRFAFPSCLFLPLRRGTM